MLRELGKEKEAAAQEARIEELRGRVVEPQASAPEPWSTSAALREKIHTLGFQQRDEQEALVERYIEEHRSKSKTKIRKHGMSNPEPMRQVEFDSVPFYYRDTARGRPYIRETIRRLAAVEQIPEELSEHTQAVYLSTQRNKADAYWEQQYNLPKFRSLATGGNGEVVVYDDPIGSGSLSHEMGHNLAWARYGTTRPPQGTDYSKATADPTEPPVSRYAGNSIAEDFAEAVEQYVVNPTRLQRIAPQRYSIIKRLLEDANYGG